MYMWCLSLSGLLGGKENPYFYTRHSNNNDRCLTQTNVISHYLSKIGKFIFELKKYMFCKASDFINIVIIQRHEIYLFLRLSTEVLKIVFLRKFMIL